MVVGMIVGATIALFCFLLGYVSGARFAQASHENVVSEEYHKPMDTIEPIEPIEPIEQDVFDENISHNTFSWLEKEREQRKATSNLFRTKKGLLSYKKFVRE